MKVFVTIEGRERLVTLTVDAGGAHLVSVDGGAPEVVDAVPVPGGLHVRFTNGVGFDLALGRAPEGRSFAAGRVRGEAVVETERERGRRARHGGGETRREVRAPMPGRIVSVHVKPGDEVEVGTPLVVVEAMKMENELRSPRAGRVKQVEVTVGASVEGRAILVVFE